MLLGQRCAVTGVVLVVVGAANGSDAAPCKSIQYLLPNVGEAGIDQQIADKISRDLETQYSRPPAGDAKTCDSLSHLIGPDPGALD